MHDKPSPATIRHQSSHHNNNNNDETPTMTTENKKWHEVSMHDIGFDDSSSIFKEERTGFGLTGFGGYLNENLS